MTYLSRLECNPRSRQVRSDMADCHSLHQRVLSAFPQAPDGVNAREHFGVLHRLEVDGHTGCMSLLVQSRMAPDWSQLPPDYLDRRHARTNPECKQIDTPYAGLSTGQHLVFRLRANPTKRVSDSVDPRWNGKRVDLHTDEERLDWLRRKGEQGSFTLLDVTASANVPDVRQRDTKQIGKRLGTDLTFQSVLFEGKLQVIDPDVFRQALTQGIGSGKAYGFGLLSIAPASAP